MSAQEERDEEDSEEESQLTIRGEKALQVAMNLGPRELVSVLYGNDAEEVRSLVRQLDNHASDLSQDPFNNSNVLRDVLFKGRALQWMLNASEQEVAEVISMARFPEGRPVTARTPGEEMERIQQMPAEEAQERARRSSRLGGIVRTEEETEEGETTPDEDEEAEETQEEEEQEAASDT